MPHSICYFVFSSNMVKSKRIKPHWFVLWSKINMEMYYGNEGWGEPQK